MAKSRYPRYGHRLAPAAVGELLQVPVPAEYLRGAELSGLKLADLDETVWEKFDEQTCRRLAAEVVRAVARAIRIPIPLGERRLPPIPEWMTLADLELEVRTINCLIAAGIHERPQDLQAMTIEQVLGLRGFWVKSLVDLLTSLEYVHDHPEARKALRTDAIITIKHLRAAHRYPRPSHRLAPQTIREVLLDPAPPRLVRGTRFRRARLCDLDESVWDYLPPEKIGRLAALIVARAATVVHSRMILKRHLPKPPPGMRLEDLRLENRTHHCLQREGFDKRPEDLGNCTIGDLMSIRAFGAKSLVDLLTSLETRVAREGRLDKRLTAEAKNLKKSSLAVDIPFTDPRLGGHLRSMDTESNTIGEMVDRLVSRRLDPPDPTRLTEQLVELRETIHRLSSLPLEEELVQIFAPTADDRDRQIVAQYYGWKGQGRHTLEELGRKYGLSRERIRQICVRAIKRNRETSVFAPVLDRALAFLAKQVPKNLDALQREFDAASFSTRPLPVPAVVEAGQYLSRNPGFVIIEVGTSQMAVLPKQVPLPPAILQVAKQVVSNFGAAEISTVMAELAGHLPKKTDPALVRETLQTRSDFRWLDRKFRWFRMDSLPQYGLPNMVDKILSVTNRIDVTKMHAAMTRYRRTGRRLPPPKILREYCKYLDGVRVEQNTIISTAHRDWREILTGVERTMVDVLVQHGPALERTVFEELCFVKGVNRFSFNAIVMSSPVIAQYGRSIYGLLGQKVDRQMIQNLLRQKSGAAASRVLKAFGRTKDGKPYLAYRLSKAAISGGVITVPSAMKQQVRGKFVLRADKGHSLGTLVTKRGCGWGLGPALRRSHAKQGDHMVLLFDPEKRQARLRIGDETILKGLSESTEQKARGSLRDTHSEHRSSSE